MVLTVATAKVKARSQDRTWSLSQRRARKKTRSAFREWIKRLSRWKARGLDPNSAKVAAYESRVRGRYIWTPSRELKVWGSVKSRPRETWTWRARFSWTWWISSK